MAAPTTCGAATAVTAPAVSQGRVLPTGQQSWWAVTFPNENGLCGKHYQIVLVNNGNPIFMNVFQNCTNTGVSCNAPSDAMSNYTTWDWTNSGANCTQAYPTTFFVEVVATASVGTCMDYSVISFIQ